MSEKTAEHNDLTLQPHNSKKRKASEAANGDDSKQQSNSIQKVPSSFPAKKKRRVISNEDERYKKRQLLYHKKLSTVAKKYQRGPGVIYRVCIFSLCFLFLPNESHSIAEILNHTLSLEY
jgi:hypothetical protein